MFDGTGQTSIAVTLNGVTAGSLIVLRAKFEGVNSTASATDGTTAFTAGTKFWSANDSVGGQFLYLLVANSGNKTYTVTLSPATDYPQVFVMEFSYLGTASFDAQSGATGSSTTPASGNITTTGTDEVVIGGYSAVTGNTTSSELINGVAATEPSYSPEAFNNSVWYRIVAATFTGQAAATLANAPWVCNVIAFKAEAAGGLSIPVVMNQYRQRRA